MIEAIERLCTALTPVPEALELFAQLRATPQEGRAVDALLVRHARAPLPEPLLVAVATALVDRGDEGAALQALVRATSNEGLVLRADLLARRGDDAEAVALVERVLLRDIDWPGARERHARWLDRIGGGPPRRATVSLGATVMTAPPESPYRLLREVGRGGAAAVYEAEDRELGRRVALKIYHRVDRDGAQLLHEARVAVSLAGEGVVRVFDVDPQHGWIAMEWAPLGALRARLRDPIDAWAASLARALARVHAAGWVHHDVKPANVLLLHDAHARSRGALLTDFGTARRVGDPSPPGSLGFVSPERLQGRASDPRDDVYGFGRVLEEALDAQTEAQMETVGAGARPDEPDASRRWRRLAAECTGPDAARPVHGSDLAARIAAR
jgi:hypothetical protein